MILGNRIYNVDDYGNTSIYNSVKNELLNKLGMSDFFDENNVASVACLYVGLNVSNIMVTSELIWF